MKGIPHELLQRLRDTLSYCDPFRSSSELRSVFVDARLVPWRDGLPEASSVLGRVDLTINYLYGKYTSTGENALFLLLRALEARTDPADALHQQLSQLVEELEREGTKRRHYETSVIQQVAGDQAIQIGRVSGDVHIFHRGETELYPTQLTKSKILIVDDEPDAIIGVVDRLESLDYDVVTAQNGAKGIEIARKENPHLILLDVMMPQMDGYEACRHLKSFPETKNIPILMLTAKGRPQDKATGLNIGADDYLDKPYEMVELIARVQALLRRTESAPFQDTSSTQYLFSIHCEPQRWINIQGNGVASFSTSTQQLLNIDVDRYSRKADNSFGHDGRFERKDLGEELYTSIFLNYPEVHGSYSQFIGIVDNNKNLHLRFKGTRDFLRVPVEFLFDHQQGEFLVLKHPFARSIVGKGIGITKKKPLSSSFFNELYRNGDTLRVLLIASNTGSPIAAVDQEIETLSDVLQALFSAKRIQIEITVFPSSKATYQTVKHELKQGNYHIIHYAGHGVYEGQSPDRSYLSFWEQENRQGTIKNMSSTTLQSLLKDSQNLRFMFLSCCEGMLTGQTQDLLVNEFLGIADAVVHAGTPSVLGYRHPVEDTSAKKLAVAFYTFLAEHGDIDTALLETRCEIAGENRNDPAWISPILILQE